MSMFRIWWASSWRRYYSDGCRKCGDCEPAAAGYERIVHSARTGVTTREWIPPVEGCSHRCHKFPPIGLAASSLSEWAEDAYDHDLETWE